MPKSKGMFIAVVGWALLSAVACAQDTNAWPVVPQTKLEALGTNVGVVLIESSTQIGGVTATAGVASVYCKEVTDTSTGRKEHGIKIVITEGGQQRDGTLVDYDELDSLIRAMEYLGKVDWSVTTLTSFEARYTTKGGLRLAALGRKRTGTIEYAVWSGRGGNATLMLSLTQLAQLRDFIEQAQRKLAAMRSAK